jgi:cysteinyl-tRNA synthetase
MFFGFLDKKSTGTPKTKEGELINRKIFFKNSLSGEKELFAPLKSDFVRLYSCGPTVYNYIHIGNIRAYLLSDFIRRALEYNNYKVKQVMNVTDIGHLTSDADEGEDKMSLALAREGKPFTVDAMIELGEFYTKTFISDIEAVNIKVPHIVPRPSDYIQEQIALIETLEGKGYTYTTKDGVYFDTKKFPAYGVLGNINIEKQKEGARVATKKEKRNPTDFALWKLNEEHGFTSPWGRGFPGWHIECSAMSRKHLGSQVDIHTGGVDLMPIHHNNEIAQSESVSGKQFVKYWAHNAFITIDGQKLSKSLGNEITIQQVREKSISPMAVRYWLLTGHYRTQMNFTWDALEGAQVALMRLYKFFVEKLSKEGGDVSIEYKKKFQRAVNDDLDTPKAIALLWDLVKDEEIKEEDKRATLLDFDKVLGFGLLDSPEKFSEFFGARTLSQDDLPSDIQILLKERETARAQKDFKEADRLRGEIEKHGYELKDTEKGTEVLDKNAGV